MCSVLLDGYVPRKYNETATVLEEGVITLKQLKSIGIAVALVMPTGALASAEGFAPYAHVLADRLVIGTERLEAAVESGDLAAAQDAWLAARPAWETGETFYGAFFPSFDEAIDTWPDAERGFHAIERLMFEDRTLDGTMEMARALAEQSAALREAIATTDMTDQGLLDGLAGITFEVGADKVDGGESPYSDTSLSDMQNNLDGIEVTYALAFSQTVADAAPELHDRILEHVAALEAALAVDSLADLNTSDVTRLSEELALLFADSADPLGLDAPEIGG